MKIWIILRSRNRDDPAIRVLNTQGHADNSKRELVRFPDFPGEFLNGISRVQPRSAIYLESLSIAFCRWPCGCQSKRGKEFSLVQIRCGRSEIIGREKAR